MERVSFLSSGDVSQNPWKTNIEPEGLMMNALLTGCSKRGNLAGGAGKWKFPRFWMYPKKTGRKTPLGCLSST